MFGPGPLHVVILGIAAALAYPTIWIAARICKLKTERMLVATVIFTGTATLCDGSAVTYFSQIYGGTGPNLAYSAGANLFGVSWLLIVAAWLPAKRNTDLSIPGQ